MSASQIRASFADGGAAVLLGADSRRGGPELVAAGQLVSSDVMAFLVRHTCGFVTVGLPPARCDQLQLPALTWCVGRDRREPAPAVAVDAAEGVSTGISAADRAHTARLLASPDSRADHFTRPGHLVPMRAYDEWWGSSTVAAGLRLCAESGLARAVVRCELVMDCGELMGDRDAVDFAGAHGLAVFHVRDLASNAA
jgi:3,4-dihydroxy-2-butanone 4-phosphate synthase